MIEDMVKECLQDLPGYNSTTRLPNLIGNRPAYHEVDCTIGQFAYEIKWRDATTDGDHVAKEIERIKNFKAHGYTPVRLMFFASDNKNSKSIQARIAREYHDAGGQYYCEQAAWDHIREVSGHDLQKILENIDRGNDNVFSYLKELAEQG